MARSEAAPLGIFVTTLFVVTTVVAFAAGLWTWPPGFAYGLAIHCAAPLLILALVIWRW